MADVLCVQGNFFLLQNVVIMALIDVIVDNTRLWNERKVVTFKMHC